MGVRALSTGRAVFLDRDGVLNRNVWYEASREWESPRDAGALVLHDGVLESLAALRGAGWRLVLVSNQPSHAKGKTSLEALAAVHARLLDLLAQAKLALDASYYCFHHPQGVVPAWSGPCACRKPSAHFLRRAERELDLRLVDCWMVGDRASDVECGERAGTRTILVAPDHPAPAYAGPRPTHEARDLAHATRFILDPARPAR